MNAVEKEKKRLCVSCLSEGTLFGRTKETEKLLAVRAKLLAETHQTDDDDGARNVVWVHGASGTGKTALCRQLQQGAQVPDSRSSEPQSVSSHSKLPTTENSTTAIVDAHSNTQQPRRHFYFAEGKFDQHQDYSMPYSALVQAFDSLGQQILHVNGDNGHHDEDRLCLQQALEHEGSTLREIIPSFETVEAPPSSNNEDGENKDGNDTNNETDSGSTPHSSSENKFEEAQQGSTDTNKLVEESNNSRLSAPSESSSLRLSQNLDMATQRLAVAFGTFIKQFCTAPNRSLILFLDDLQWGDRNSLDVLLALLNDSEMPHHFLVVCGYREELKGNLETFFQQVDANKIVATDILLQNLKERDIHDLLTAMLSMEPEDTAELADIVFHKTDGNPFFVLQFLDALHRLKLLKYDLMSVKWTWNMSLIRSNTDVADNVAEVVTQRLNSVSPDVRRLLQLAACLGFQIDRSLLEQIYTDTAILMLEDNGSETKQQEEETHMDSNSSFDLAASYAEEDALLETAGSSIKFSHDRIRQLAYELVPTKGHDSSRVHYELGEYLKETFGDSRSSPYFLLAADQLNRGSDSAVQSNADRVALIQLNLEASKVARQRSGEALVFSFLSKAVMLTKEQDWDESYEVTLEIHTRLAEIETARGCLEHSKALVDSVLKHARRPSDTATALAVSAQSLAYTLRTVEAVTKAREALSALDVDLKCPNMFNMLRESARVKRLVKDKTDQDLLSLPMMTSKLMKKAMRILTMVAVYGFGADDRLTTGLAFNKMMELTIKHGISSSTASAFGGYAQILSAVGKRDESYRFAQLALQLTCKENVASTTSFIHGLCLHLKRPLALSLEPTLFGYRTGIQSGDVFFGGICLAKYMQLYVLCGLPLLPFSSDCKNFAGQLKLLHQGRMVLFVIPNLVLALNLTGQLKDFRKVSWHQGVELQIMEESELHLGAIERSPANSMLLYCKLFIACVMNDAELMKEAIQCIGKLRKSQQRFFGTHMGNYLFALLDGLCGFSLFETSHKRKYFRLARRAVKELSDMHTINSVPLHEFLLARRASVTDFPEKEKVKSLYDKAITSLVRSGFTHYGAMAYECAGRYMMKHNDEYWAREYVQHSVALYGEWNASTKVDQMRAEFSEFFVGDNSTHRAESGGFLRGRKRFQSISSALVRNNTDATLGVGQTTETSDEK